jgi:hypothetical protein
MEPQEALQGTYWFPLRRYLPGWGLPVCWQGWLVVAAYFVLLVGPSLFFGKSHPGFFVGYAFLLTAVLFCVVVKKGETHR